MSKNPKHIIMHFSDGSTLTGEDLYPHELSEEQNSQLTSVERVIGGWNLTILKSPVIKSFFVMSTVHQDMKFGQAGRQAPKRIVDMFSLGCYIKDSDPPIRLTLHMEPDSKNTQLHVERVNSFRADGFARALKPIGKLRNIVTKDIGKNMWGILSQPPIKRIYPTKEGIGCLIEVQKANPNNSLGPIISRVMAELKRNGKSCQLSVQPG